MVYTVYRTYVLYDYTYYYNILHEYDIRVKSTFRAGYNRTTLIRFFFNSAVLPDSFGEWAYSQIAH